MARLWLSCFDLAWAAFSALAAFFFFWSRSFDFGDLSPTCPSGHTIAFAPLEGKWGAGKGGRGPSPEGRAGAK